MAIQEITVSKIYILATEPTKKVKDRFWFDTTNNILKRYDGTTWKPISVSSDDVAVLSDGSKISLTSYLNTQIAALAEGIDSKQDKLKFYSETDTEAKIQSPSDGNIKFDAANIHLGVLGYITLEADSAIQLNSPVTGTAISTSIPASESAVDNKLPSEKAVATELDKKQDKLTTYSEIVGDDWTNVNIKPVINDGTDHGAITLGYVTSSNVFPIHGPDITLNSQGVTFSGSITLDASSPDGSGAGDIIIKTGGGYGEGEISLVCLDTNEYASGKSSIKIGSPTKYIKISDGKIDGTLVDSTIPESYPEGDTTQNIPTSKAVRTELGKKQNKLNFYSEQGEPDSDSTSAAIRAFGVSINAVDTSIGYAPDLVGIIVSTHGTGVAINGNVSGTAISTSIPASESAVDTKLPSEKAVATAIAGKADKATTLAGYNISDAYTKTETDSAIDNKIATASETLQTAIDAKVAKADIATTIPAEAAEASDTKVASEKAVATAVAGINATVAGKADKATTLAGYGITDAYTKTEVNTELGKKQNKLVTYSEILVDGGLEGDNTYTHAYIEAIDITLTPIQGYINLEGELAGSAISTSIPASELAVDTKLPSEKAVADAIKSIKATISTAYKYKGSDTYANIVAKRKPAVGDVWNSTTANGVYPKGTNYAWNGTEWDALGGEVDLSAYQKASDSALTTTSKTVVGAINEVKGVADAAAKADASNITVSTWKNKLGFITADEVTAQVQPDWNASSGAAEILNKPDISTCTYSWLQFQDGFDGTHFVDIPLTKLNGGGYAIYGSNNYLDGVYNIIKISSNAFGSHNYRSYDWRVIIKDLYGCVMSIDDTKTIIKDAGCISSIRETDDGDIIIVIDGSEDLTKYYTGRVYTVEVYFLEI